MALNIAEIKKLLSNTYQRIRKNILSLGDDSTLESDLKPLKIGDKVSPLEMSETELNVRGTINAEAINVGGSAVVTDITETIALNDLSDVAYSSGDLTIASLDTIVGHVTMKIDDGEPDGFTGKIDGATANFFSFGGEIDANSIFRMYERGGSSAGDYFQTIVGEHGETTISTVDAAAAVGHLTLDIDGDIILDPVSGITKFYKAGDTDDSCALTVDTNGETTIATVDSSPSLKRAKLTLNADGNIMFTPATGFILIDATDKLCFDGTNVGTYITETSDDVLDFYVGTDKMLTLDEANDKITMGATNWVAGTVSGGTVTEFSAENSAYAGMILGYSVFRNLTADAGNETIGITTSMTVLETAEGNKLNVSFVAPPSGKVEIVLSALFQANSRSVAFSLSDNATYNEVNAIHTYDGPSIKPDETDYVAIYVPWVVEGLTAGTSYQYWIAGASSSSTVWLYHGVDRTDNVYSQPIAIKATALPATIVNEE